MFIIITAERAKANEIELIRKMARFPISIHVRKPFFGEKDLMKWLSQFDENQHQKMMLHTGHKLIEQFNLKGLHFKENHLKDENLNHLVEKYHARGKKLSASFHSQNEAESQTQFDYVLLSPVFDSVSKKNYKGKIFQLNNPRKPIIALGGITQQNIEKAKIKGFSGVAVLGSIWQCSSPLVAFKNMFNQYEKKFLKK